MTTADKQHSSTADGVRWNLNDLYKSPDDPSLNRDLEAALARAQAFEKSFRGKINVPGGPGPELLLGALVELENLYEQMDMPSIYAGLLHASKTDEPKHGALLSRAREQRTVINKHLIFFDLEWVKLDHGPARALLADGTLGKYRHYLEHKRAWRPHYLSEPEEKILDDKAITGRSAFVRLFDETLATIRFPFELDGQTEKLSLQQLLTRLYDANRSVRKEAARGITAGLKENARLLSYIFNNLVLDHKSDCTLRSFASPMSPRHLANEISDTVVDALMTAAERHHSTVERYYHLKRRLLGLDKLFDYDRYAPLFEETKCEWTKARQIVHDSYERFSPQAGSIVRQFFEGSWIDAELRPGKRSGAFSSSAVPSAHPYILLNYNDKLRDVMTLAHELGHGLHQYLSRPVGYLQCDTPLTTAEMASVFGEMLTFERLLQLYPEPRIRLSLLCSKIEDGFATVFRQVVLTRFEQAVHRARREKGELTAEQIGELWMTANRPMHGTAVEMTDDYSWWWLYIGHFIHTPFYCYAYAFGELLVLALVQKYKQEGRAFVPRYLELLASGGSDRPDVLLAKMGVDVTDPSFWALGLKLLDNMVSEAEKLSATI
jgi:oligoendopeptidase F